MTGGHSDEAMKDGATATLVSYLTNLERSDLSVETHVMVRKLLLDYLGVTLIGSRDESSLAVVTGAGRAADGNRCTVIGRGPSSGWGAALANGTAAHALELDDGHLAGPIHPGVVIFSAAIAASELTDGPVDGGRFATAVVAGYEMMIRVALAMGAGYSRGFHPTGICGVFGATVTASRLLGLDAERTTWAVGIAASMAGGCLQCLWDGSWTKRLHGGLAASNGLTAALLASAGFRGPGSALEGRSGFLQAYSDSPRPDLLVDSLGERFGILDTIMKAHACCRGCHPQIDGVLELGRRRRLVPSEIVSIEVTALEMVFPLVCEPAERKYNPTSLVDAQFSLPYAVSVAAIFGQASLAEYSETVLGSPEVRDLMRRVRIVRNPEFDSRYPRQFPARVTIEFTDGARLDVTVEQPKGSPENPLTWAEMNDKYHVCADEVIGQAASNEVSERVDQLETLSNVAPIWHLCRRDDGAARKETSA